MFDLFLQNLIFVKNHIIHKVICAIISSITLIWLLMSNINGDKNRPAPDRNDLMPEKRKMN
jgi:hypothetical protein